MNVYAQIPATPTYPVAARAGDGPPGPVRAVSVLLYICSGLSVIVATVLAVGGAVGSATSDIPVAGHYGERVAFIGFGGAVLLVTLAGVDIVLGICLWKGRGWARTATVGLAVLSVPVALAVPAPGGVVLDLAVAVLFIALLTLPRRVRQFFAVGTDL